jgi:GNAT superfamily N-acetyltransferase
VLRGRIEVTGGPAAGVRIRVAGTNEHWQAIRSLCCRTGDGGAPIDRARWPLFAELWVGPYQRLVPAWTYVAESGDRVVGYLNGCPDTVAFRRARRFRVTLPLLLAIACGRYAWNADARRTVELAVGRRRGTEARMTTGLPVDFIRSYPAHLHMNVEAEYRGHRIGAQLIERYVRDLRTAGVPGIHLFCGAAPRPFYARHGFTELTTLEVGGASFRDIVSKQE